jgi:hypothetical protein
LLFNVGINILDQPTLPEKDRIGILAELDFKLGPLHDLIGLLKLDAFDGVNFFALELIPMLFF